MSIIKYDRTNSLFPSLFDDFFTDLTFFDDPIIKHHVLQGDVIESDDAFNIELMMPGFNKKDISMKVEKDSLIISAERKKVEDVKYNSAQSYFGKFKKSYTLPDYVDVDKIDAAYENGVLKVKVPKKENASLNKVIEIT